MVPLNICDSNRSPMNALIIVRHVSQKKAFRIFGTKFLRGTLRPTCKPITAFRTTLSQALSRELLFLNLPPGCSGGGGGSNDPSLPHTHARRADRQSSKAVV